MTIDNVRIVDSVDGYNPVFLIKQETENGVRCLQFDKWEAEQLRDKLTEKLDELEEVEN